MKKLDNKELYNVVGGVKFSASLLSSIIKGANFVLELGRYVGTAIRRMRTGRLC